MRFISYLSDNHPRIAVRAADGFIDLHTADASLPTCMRQFLAMGQPGLQAAEKVIASGQQTFQLESVQLLAPVPEPQKVICIGLNYADHAAETGAQIPSQPVVFNKFPTSVRAHGDNIELPAVSNSVDYEAELVVVIGTAGKNIAEEDALSHVAGYTCGHDVSARDWQKGTPGGQWLLGKTFDSFAPFGPELVTPDEAGDPGNLKIALRLNGQTLQDSTTAQLIFPVAHLIAHVSQCCTLLPGDVIFTGTPPGVGAARKPPIWLKPGDTAEVEIENLGILKNPIIAAS